MIAAIFSMTRGEGLMQRALRSSSLNVFGFGAQQVLRLGSNLILTRLLFPEAFGVMAMVSVFLTGLAMFSDVGVSPAIMHSKRGDEPDFLNTAWTMQIIRGLALWGAACAFAWPISLYFGEPDLVYYLPVAALTLVIDGFVTTREDTANRHLRAGRLTVLRLAVQVAGLCAAVGMAWWLRSVWALVLSGLFSTLVKVVLFDLFLPGARNRLRWDPTAVHELVHFGKWIFLSTVCGFVMNQADKVVIGGYLSTSNFGIYNIGYFWASFPFLLGLSVVPKLMLPLYRDSPPAASAENFARLRRVRGMVTAGLLGLSGIVAIFGVWVIALLYDPRYLAAGGVVTLIAVAQIPVLIGLTYDQAALADGDSRRFFIFTAVRAVLIVAGLAGGTAVAGLPGALIGQGLAMLGTYPVLIWLARHKGAWDPGHDARFAVIGAGLGAVALWVNWDAIITLARIGPG